MERHRQNVVRRRRNAYLNEYERLRAKCHAAPVDDSVSEAYGYRSPISEW